MGLEICLKRFVARDQLDYDYAGLQDMPPVAKSIRIRQLRQSI